MWCRYAERHRAACGRDGAPEPAPLADAAALADAAPLADATTVADAAPLADAVWFADVVGFGGAVRFTDAVWLPGPVRHPGRGWPVRDGRAIRPDAPAPNPARTVGVGAVPDRAQEPPRHGDTHDAPLSAAPRGRFAHHVPALAGTLSAGLGDLPRGRAGTVQGGDTRPGA
ncbi:hypothetical protein JCM9957A_11540 [Kineosporia succinea]